MWEIKVQEFNESPEHNMYFNIEYAPKLRKEIIKKKEYNEVKIYKIRNRNLEMNFFYVSN